MKALRTRLEDHRLALVTLLVVSGASALLVWASISWAQSPIPHAEPEAYAKLGKSQDCLACHQAGVNGAPRLAADHVGRGNEDCLVCHQYTGALPSLIPHPEEGQEECLDCHEFGIGRAGPLAGDHVTYANDQCLDCHHVAPGVPTPTPVLPTPTAEPGHVQGPISQTGCVECHQLVPVDARHTEIVDQLPGDLAEGQALYAENCARCHGENGDEAVETASGKDVVINSVDFLSQRDDAAIIVGIAAGLPDAMPAFGPDGEGQLSWSGVRTVAQLLRGWAPSAIRIPTGGDAAYGSDLYAEHCAACHGGEGQGGPAAREPINTHEYLVGISDDALRQAILEGVPGMPGLGYRLNDAQATDLIAFMRDWQER